ncbi:MAG: hypothetical protein M3R67_09310, partial [Acidobacteriota bacterium]|nr:hypothetical protein [Acidobacteriota bacterium]
MNVNDPIPRIDTTPKLALTLATPEQAGSVIRKGFTNFGPVEQEFKARANLISRFYKSTYFERKRATP